MMKASARRLLRASLLLAGTWFLRSPPAHADQEAGFSIAGQAEVATASGPAPPDIPATSDASGGLVTSVALAIPELRGHAPRVSLAYNSASNADGPVGVGWQLRAASQIRRVSPGSGIPRYDDSDTFTLDGTELLPCAAITRSTPGCAYPAPGEGLVHYATKRDLGIRVAHDTVANRWLVWNQDGVRSEYAEALTTYLGHTHTWALSTVVDPKDPGITTQYSYVSPLVSSATIAAQLSRISYGPYEVEFHYAEDGGHARTEALGDETWAIDPLSLRTVVIKNTAFPQAPLRAYRLSYAASPATGRNLLISVEEFGSDVTCDESGAILGGTALPPRLYRYDAQEAMQPVSTTFSTFTPPAPGPASSQRLLAPVKFTLPLAVDSLIPFGINLKHLSIDLNGDGRSDHVIVWWDFSTIHLVPFVTQATGDYELLPELALDAPFSRFLVADFDGDGALDIMVLSVHDNTDIGDPSTLRRVAALVTFDDEQKRFVARPSASVEPLTLDGYKLPPSFDPYDDAPQAADVNGDGLADLVRVTSDDPTEGNVYGVPVTVQYFHATVQYGYGDGRFTIPSALDDTYVVLSNTSSSVPVLGLRDMNGDGRATPAWAYLSYDSSTHTTEIDTPNYGSLRVPGDARAQIQWQMVDVNGDGIPEDVVTYPDSGSTFEEATPNKNIAVFALDWKAHYSLADAVAMFGWHAVDFDRDGRMDFVGLRAPSGYDCAAGPTTQVSLVAASAQPRKNDVAADIVTTVPPSMAPIHRTLNCTGRYPLGNSYDWAPYAESSDIADHDGDGYPDVVTFSTRGAPATYLDAAGQPCPLPGNCKSIVITLTPEVTYGVQPPSDIAGWRIADVDGDGYSDLVRLTDLRPGLRVETRLGQKSGGYGAATAQTLPLSLPSITPDQFRIADVNGDGRQDFVLPRFNTSGGYQVQIVSLISGGDGTFTVHESLAGVPFPADNQRSWFVLDQDGDGRSDLVYLRPSSSYTTDDECFFRQTFTAYTFLAGDESFTSPNILGVPLETCSVYPKSPDWKVADVNGDGRQDLVGIWPSGPVALQHQNAMVTMLSSGPPGGFTAVNRTASDPSGHLPGVPPWMWQPVRANADNAADLVALRHDGAWILWGTGDGVFGGREMVASQIQPSSAPLAYARHRTQWRMGDFDGDGVVDFARAVPKVDPTLVAARAACEAQQWSCSGQCYAAHCDFSTPPNCQGSRTSTLICEGDPPPPPCDDAALYACIGACGTPYQACLSAADSALQDAAGFQVTLFLQRSDLVTPFVAEPMGLLKNHGPSLGTLFADDIDGDRRADLEWRQYDAGLGTVLDYQWSRDSLIDQITTLTSPLGGVTTASYATARSYGQQLSDPANGCRLVGTGHVLQSLVQDAKVPGSPPAETGFVYGCPTWIQEERRNGGWKAVTAVDPPTANRPEIITDRRYDVTGACGSRLRSTAVSDLAGNATQQDLVFAPTGAIPYDCRASDAYRTDTDANGGQLQGATHYDYDEFGLVSVAVASGDASVDGRQRVTATTRSIAPDAFIVKPVLTSVSEGGVALSTTQFCYDVPEASGCQPPTTAGLLTAVRRLEDDGGWSTTRYAYDAAGNTTLVSDPNGHATQIVFDPADPARRFPTVLINAVGQVATLTFDDRTGEVLARHDANGVGITHTYDAFGRETLVAAADGGSTRTSYDNLGMPGVQSISVVVDDGGAGIYTRRTLDGLGRTVTVQRSGGAAGVVQHIAYADASAHPSFQSHWADVGGPVVSEAFTYDFRGRLAGVTHPDGSGTSMIYTARGRTAVDEVGSQRTTEIDAWGLTRRVVEPHNGGVVTTTYEYDALDRVVRSTDPAGNVIQSTYDKLGRLVGATDPDLGQLTYTYDDAGNILTAVDGRGVVTTFTYDASNRITGKTNSLNGRSIALHYDEPSSAHGIGRLTSVEDDESGPGCARGSVLSYDELGRVVSQTECLDGVTQTLTRSYDIAGHPRRITFPDGDVMDYLYDSMGHVVSVPGYVTEIRYDAEDRPTRLALANGVVRNRTYDPARSWLAAETLTGPSGVLRTASYTRRADALVLAEATTTNVKTPVVENVSYAYDEQGRLVATSGSLVEHFAYDLIGNMISKSGVAYTYPAYGPGQPRVHAALSAGTTTFDYDGGGNLVAERDSKGKAVRTFTWDESGALAAVHAPGSTGKGAFTAYGYNAFGLRTREVVIDGKITSTTLTFFPEVETNGGPHLVKHCFVAGQRLASKDWKGAVTYYHTNPLGSVVLLTDASGAIAKGNAFFRYDSFGARLSGNAAQANGFTFTGQRQTDLTSPDAANPGLGLVHMGARTYDPSTARFLSPDTVMPGRGVLGRNRYAYANQNPRAYVDPSGHEGEPTEEEPPPAGWTTDGHGNAVSLADYTKDDGTLVIHEVAPVPEPAPAPLFSGSSGLAVPSTTPAPSLDTVYANGARTDVFLVTTSDRQLYADTLSQINFSNRRQIVVDARGLSPQQVYDSLRAIGDTQNKRLIVEDHGTWASRGGNVMFWGDGQITAEWLKSNPALAELLGKTLGLFGEVELTHCNIACGDGRLLTTLSSLAPATVIYGNSGPGNVERVSGEALECFVGACQSVIREPEGP